MKGTAKGTYFTASGHNMKTRLQWMAFYAPSAGNLYVDEGAAEALAVQAKSLLPKGIVAVEGDLRKAMSSASSGAAAMNISERALSTMTGGSAENHERKHQPHGSNQPR